jgi:hypothetical protein
MFSDRPYLRPCRTSCRHCGILFITYPCNRDRTDLRCPFGCRETHTTKSSAERVAAYYSTKDGKTKKKALNNKRSKHAPESNSKKEQRKQTTRSEPTQPGTSPAPLELDTNPPLPEPDTRAVLPVQDPSIEAGPQEEAPGQGEQDASPAPEGEGTSIANEDIQFDAGMVKYVQLVTSLIEGRPVSRDEILQMLRRVMRQHSLNTERRIDYSLRYLTENPP